MGMFLPEWTESTEKMYVAIEGIDKSGKDTLLEYLKQIIDSAPNEFPYSINNLTNPPKDEHEDEIRNPDTTKSRRDELFLRGFLKNDQQLIHGLNLVNRCFLSNIAYDDNKDTRDHNELEYHIKLVKPSLVILIHLDLPTIKERYMNSELDHFEAVKFSKLELRQKRYLEFIKKHNINYIQIDGKEVLLELGLVQNAIYRLVKKFEKEKTT